MTEYIKREAALLETCNLCPLDKCMEPEHRCADYAAISRIPAADVQEVRHRDRRHLLL